MRNLKIILILAVMVQLISCSTISNKEKLTSDDCMVLIPVGVDRPVGTHTARTYTLHVSGLDKSIKISKKAVGYIEVKIRRDSQDIIALKSKITDSNFTGKSSNDEMFKDLPYSPGQVVACDFRIIQKMEEVAPNRYISSIDFKPVSADEQKELVNKFMSQPANASWFE